MPTIEYEIQQITTFKGATPVDEDEFVFLKKLHKKDPNLCAEYLMKIKFKDHLVHNIAINAYQLKFII